MELRRLRFYNSLNTDGPVIFKKDGLTGILQKAFDDILANNPKAPKLTVQGDELNQIYFPGNFDTPTYGFAAFHQSTYNNLFVEGLSITAGIRLDYEKANLDYHSAVDSMKIGVEMGPMKMTLPVTTTMDATSHRISCKYCRRFRSVTSAHPKHSRISRSPKDTRQEDITCRCSAIWSRPKPNTT